MIISESTAADLPLFKSLQPAGWGDIMPNMTFYMASDFCYVAKAMINEQIAGCGVVIMHGNCAWLANIMVNEAFRNKGIGSSITKHLVEYAEGLTESVVLIATKFGYPIYKKLGFMDNEEYSFFSGGQVAPPADARIVAYDGTFKSDLFAIDYAITGEKREHILTPKLKDAFVFRNEQGLISGFTIPTLGEGLTLAYQPEAGLALMHKNLADKGRIALPKANKPAIDSVLEHGFALMPEIYAIKMYKGRKIDWQPEQTYGRIGGNMG